MAYTVVNSHRIPYDIDGTAVGLINNTTGDPFVYGIGSWLDSVDKGKLNNNTREKTWVSYQTSSNTSQGWYFFFHEQKEITHFTMLTPPGSVGGNYGSPTLIITGSNDTTNGMDGTWVVGTISIPSPTGAFDFWRSGVRAISFPSPIKVMRIRMNGYMDIYTSGLQIYGMKAVGQTLDDIEVCNTSGVTITELIEFGDRPEGTTEIKSFKLKNVSPDKIANNVNLQLNDNDFSISFSESGPWTSVLDIASMGIGSLSNTIYVRNLLGPPLLTLGPKAARVIISIGSWG